MQLVRARQALANTRLEILDARIRACVLRAPFDGVVISGDLRAQVGRVFAKGHPLFQIARRDGWMLEIRVPEADVDELRAGLVGDFAPNARPETTAPLRLLRIRPQAETPGQANVYVAEAETQVEFAWLRPGMEGVAKIHIASRPVWWILSHRAVDAVRMRIW